MKTVPRNVQIVTQDQAVEAAGLTPALVESAHPRAEVHGLLDGPGHRHLPLLVAGVVVPRRCLVVESPMFVHGLDPSPALSARTVYRAVEPRRCLDTGTRGGRWHLRRRWRGGSRLDGIPIRLRVDRVDRDEDRILHDLFLVLVAGRELRGVTRCGCGVTRLDPPTVTGDTPDPR